MGGWFAREDAGALEEGALDEGDEEHGGGAEGGDGAAAEVYLQLRVKKNYVDFCRMNICIKKTNQSGLYPPCLGG